MSLLARYRRWRLARRPRVLIHLVTPLQSVRLQCPIPR